MINDGRLRKRAKSNRDESFIQRARRLNSVHDAQGRQAEELFSAMRATACPVHVVVSKGARPRNSRPIDSIERLEVCILIKTKTKQQLLSSG